MTGTQTPDLMNYKAMYLDLARAWNELCDLFDAEGNDSPVEVAHRVRIETEVEARADAVRGNMPDSLTVNGHMFTHVAARRVPVHASSLKYRD